MPYYHKVMAFFGQNKILAHSATFLIKRDKPYGNTSAGEFNGKENLSPNDYRAS
jgi:hypothetical protein